MTNKPMLSVELFPCPMCSGKVREPVAKHIGHGDFCFVVSCNCGLSFDGGQDVESAVRTWNRRAKPVAQLQAEPVAWLSKCKDDTTLELAYPNEKATNPEHWTDAFPVYAAPPAIKLHLNVSNVEVTVNAGGSYTIDPATAPITDDQILEAMRPAITGADGGYVFDTAKADVVSAGRALLDAVARLNGVNKPKDQKGE